MCVCSVGEECAYIKIRSRFEIYFKKKHMYRKYSANLPCQTKVFLRYLQSLIIAFTVKNLSLTWRIGRVFTVYL
jgi:hypothetical protein